MDELEAGPLELLGGGRNGFGALDVELEARLRTRAVGRPLTRAEAGLGGLPERQTPKCFAPSTCSLCRYSSPSLPVSGRPSAST